MNAFLSYLFRGFYFAKIGGCKVTDYTSCATSTRCLSNASLPTSMRTADVEVARDMSGSLQLCTLGLCTSSTIRHRGDAYY